MFRAGLLSLGIASVATAGCASAPRQAPGLPPTPASVTREEPGGDAADPDLAALERLEHEAWGFKKDKFQTLRVPLPDMKNWRRGRIPFFPMRGIYWYGAERYAGTAVWYVEAEEGKDDLETCAKRFFETGNTAVEKFGSVEYRTRPLEPNDKKTRAKKKVHVVLAEGHVDSIIVSDDYVGAVAAVESWPGTCLVYGFAVASGLHPEVAVRVRDRWIEEGIPRIAWERKIKQAPTFDAR